MKVGEKKVTDCEADVRKASGCRVPCSYGRWERFIDKLAGGPPNQEKLDKLKGRSWLVRYNVSLVMVVSWLLIGIAPEVVNQINGVPEPSTMQTLQVRILRTHPTEPHLLVELPDGTQRGMEWPIKISFLGGFRSYVWSDQQREALPGCLATVQGASLRWTLHDRFRIWNLVCNEKDISIGFDETIKSRRSQNDFLSKFIFIVFCSGLYLFNFVIFLREKRGNL